MDGLVRAFRSIPWRYYGVWLLPLGGLMGMAGYGTVLYSWPVFFPVVIKDLGWTAAVAATASSLARMEGGIEGPVVGWILDKYGPRVIMFTGGLLMGLGFIALHWMTDIVYYYVVFGVIINLGYNAGLYASSYKAVANWWVKWRARAISIMILPTALGGTFGPMLSASAIQRYGWRTSVLLLGIVVLAIYIPTSLLVRPKRPEAYGLLPDGDDPKAVAAAAPEAKATEDVLARATMRKETDWTTGQALRVQAFWIYSLASIFTAFAGGVVVLFAPSQLRSVGFDLQTAAFYAGLMLSLTYIGRFTVMAIGDLVNPKYMIAIAWVFQGLGCLSLALVTKSLPMLALGYGLFYGVGYGMSIPLGPTVRGWLFGRASFGTISGIVGTVAMIGSVTAPTFAGHMYDITKTYQFAYTSFFAAFVAAAVIFVFAKRPVPKAVPSVAPVQVSA